MGGNEQCQHFTRVFTAFKQSISLKLNGQGTKEHEEERGNLSITWGIHNASSTLATVGKGESFISNDLSFTIQV